MKILTLLTGEPIYDTVSEGALLGGITGGLTAVILALVIALLVILRRRNSGTAEENDAGMTLGGSLTNYLSNECYFVLSDLPHLAEKVSSNTYLKFRYVHSLKAYYYYGVYQFLY